MRCCALNAVERQMPHLILIIFLTSVQFGLSGSSSNPEQEGCPHGKLIIPKGGNLPIPGCKRLVCRDGEVRVEFCPPVPDRCIDVRGDKSLPFPECCDSWTEDCEILTKRNERTLPGDDSCITSEGSGNKCSLKPDVLDATDVDTEDAEEDHVKRMKVDISGPDVDESSDNDPENVEECTGAGCSLISHEGQVDHSDSIESMSRVSDAVNSDSVATPDLQSALKDRIARFDFRSKEYELCYTKAGFLRAGDTADLEGCQQVLCEREGRSYIFACEVPPGCRLVRQNFSLPFPECCPVINCPEAPEGTAHISELPQAPTILAVQIVSTGTGAFTSAADSPLISSEPITRKEASDSAPIQPTAVFTHTTTAFNTMSTIDGGCRLESGRIIPNGTTVSDFQCRGLTCANGFLRVTCCQEVPVGCSVVRKHADRKFPGCCPQYICLKQFDSP